MRSQEKFELTGCMVEKETAAALLISIPTGPGRSDEHWIPLSQIHSIHREEGRVVMSAWIAKQKGFI